MVVQSQQPIPVPFRGATLYIVDYNGEPFVPMRPIVEGMGLDWASQTVKFNSNKNRWGVVMITIPSVGGMQETLCIPHRKLPGWLMTIQPSRVKPEIRDTIVVYQNECDDVLWQYWTQGQVVNPRIALPQDFHSDLLSIAKAAEASAKAIQASFDAAQSLANTVRALVDKYASHAITEQSPNALTCQHIVNCEQRTQPQLPSSLSDVI